MIIFSVAVLIFILLWVILIYIRKSMWDTVHRNLLDLEDAYEGKVIRKSMLARPIFHGKIENNNLTLNFSTAKGVNGRINYIDISYDLNTPCSITLTSLQWLEEQTDEKQEDTTIVTNSSGVNFLIRPSSKGEVKRLISQDTFTEFIDVFSDLGYFFSGKTGILCEFFSDNVAEATKFENMQKRLELIIKLAKAIQ